MKSPGDLAVPGGFQSISDYLAAGHHGRRTPRSFGAGVRTPARRIGRRTGRGGKRGATRSHPGNDGDAAQGPVTFAGHPGEGRRAVRLRVVHGGAVPVVPVERTGARACTCTVGQIVQDFDALESEPRTGGDADGGEDAVLRAVLQDGLQTTRKLTFQLGAARLVQLQQLIDLGAGEARGRGARHVVQPGIVDRSVGSGESGVRRLVAAASREAHGDGRDEGDPPGPLFHGLHGGFPSVN